jgi:thiosulfate/3-mercaptopyruvate sulfurtransferase
MTDIKPFDLTVPGPLVSTAWLADRLGRPGLMVLDGSWYLPAAGRGARAEYLAAHIPGALFFDLDQASDSAVPLPHTLPSAEAFTSFARALGVGAHDTVVVYDGSGVNVSAPRVWWMFRVFGLERVAVLDGGFGQWAREGRATAAGDEWRPPGDFTATLRTGAVRDYASVRAAMEARSAQIVDTRPADRFEGSVPEPRPGLRSGHIPGSHNVPFASLVRENGTMLPPERLGALLASAGVAADRPVIASCGSGTSACALLLALDLLGRRDASLYDGSWSDWGGRADAPVETDGATKKQAG